MKQKTADDFFNSIDYVSIIDTIKGIYTSDGSMSTLLDYERVLDEADLYAFKNWELGELVQGPTVKRYTVTCVFMWPYKLMPDPRGAKRLLAVGCKIKFATTKIKVPVEIESYDDYIDGTKYPKSKEREVWLVSIEIPIELMDDIKEGSIDLAEQSIDLDELDDAYDDDLDKDDGDGSDDDSAPQDQMDAMGGAAPMAGTQPPAM
jgi:hypothetical protein